MKPILIVTGLLIGLAYIILLPLTSLFTIFGLAIRKLGLMVPTLLFASQT